jgi:hypothetical protein
VITAVLAVNAFLFWYSANDTLFGDHIAKLDLRGQKSAFAFGTAKLLMSCLNCTVLVLVNTTGVTP